MHLKFAILVVLGFLSLSASHCEEKIRFLQPQPRGKRNIPDLSKEVQGTYLFSSRNFESDYEIAPFSEFEQFIDTIGAILDMDIDLYDTLTISIYDHQIIREGKQFLTLEDKCLTEYLWILLHLKEIEAVKRLVSVDLVANYLDMDTIIFADNAIHFIQEFSTYIYFCSGMNTYLVKNQDTIFSAHDEGSSITGSLVEGNTAYSYLFKDNCLNIAKDSQQVLSIQFNDSSLYVYEKYKLTAGITMRQKSIDIFSYTSPNEIDDRIPVDRYDGGLMLEILHLVDTIFDHSPGNVIRKNGNTFYLSSRECYPDSISQEDLCFWQVTSMQVQKDLLSLSILDDSTGLQLLERSMEILPFHAKDTCYNIVDPSRRQFRRFVRNGGFSQVVHYRRID